LRVHLLNWEGTACFLQILLFFHQTHTSSEIDPILSQFKLMHVLDPIFLRHWRNINPAQVCLQTSRFSSGQQPTWLHVFFISQIRAKFSANLTLTALMHMLCTSEHGRWERTGTHSTQRCAHLELQPVLCYSAKFKFRGSCKCDFSSSIRKL
jgi:hypothetical protein